jgi:hypothetical protein
VEVDLEADSLEVRFDPRRVSTEAILQVVAKQGFQGKIK